MAETATRDNLMRFAQNRMRDHNGHVTRLRVSDTKMELPSLELFKTIIDDIRDQMPHENEYTKLNAFDCDDYSFILKGLISQWYRHNRPSDLPFAMGIAWGFFNSFSRTEFHSLNFVFIADDRKLRWIEPQFLRSKSLEQATARFRSDLDEVSLLML
ncbi:MAG: lectin MOA-related protein [Pseudomonadota bacterium]